MYRNIYFLNYGLFVLSSFYLTIYVGKALHKDGQVFLDMIVPSSQDVSIRVNNMLLVGYYLVNLGLVAIFITHSETPDSWRALVEVLAHNLGIVLIVLGLLHWNNLFVCALIKYWKHRQVPT